MMISNKRLIQFDSALTTKARKMKRIEMYFMMKAVTDGSCFVVQLEWSSVEVNVTCVWE